MNLNDLISEIKREQKLDVNEIFEVLTDAIAEGCDENYTYMTLYKKAYGDRLNEKIARMWVKNMDVTDGSERATGEKWTVEQTSQVASNMHIDMGKLNKWEWYTAMNMAYSDKYEVAKEYDIADDAEYFAAEAKAEWISDKDVKGKTLLSYYCNYVM